MLVFDDKTPAARLVTDFRLQGCILSTLDDPVDSTILHRTHRRLGDSSLLRKGSTNGRRKGMSQYGCTRRL